MAQLFVRIAFGRRIFCYSLIISGYDTQLFDSLYSYLRGPTYWVSGLPIADVVCIH
jgi:hypothetical protein